MAALAKSLKQVDWIAEIVSDTNHYFVSVTF